MLNVSHISLLICHSIFCPARQVLAAGANAIAAVRSPKTSKDLQDLQLQYPEALTIVAIDVGVFSSAKVRPGHEADTDYAHRTQGSFSCHGGGHTVNALLPWISRQQRRPHHVARSRLRC